MDLCLFSWDFIEFYRSRLIVKDFISFHWRPPTRTCIECDLFSKQKREEHALELSYNRFALICIGLFVFVAFYQPPSAFIRILFVLLKFIDPRWMSKTFLDAHGFSIIGLIFFEFHKNIQVSTQLYRCSFVLLFFHMFPQIRIKFVYFSNCQ